MIESLLVVVITFLVKLDQRFKVLLGVDDGSMLSENTVEYLSNRVDDWVETAVEEFHDRDEKLGNILLSGTSTDSLGDNFSSDNYEERRDKHSPKSWNNLVQENGERFHSDSVSQQEGRE